MIAVQFFRVSCSLVHENTFSLKSKRRGINRGNGGTSGGMRCGCVSAGIEPQHINVDIGRAYDVGHDQQELRPRSLAAQVVWGWRNLGVENRHSRWSNTTSWGTFASAKYYELAVKTLTTRRGFSIKLTTVPTRSCQHSSAQTGKDRSVFHLISSGQPWSLVQRRWSFATVTMLVQEKITKKKMPVIRKKGTSREETRRR